VGLASNNDFVGVVVVTFCQKKSFFKEQNLIRSVNEQPYCNSSGPTQNNYIQRRRENNELAVAMRARVDRRVTLFFCETWKNKFPPLTKSPLRYNRNHRRFTRVLKQAPVAFRSPLVHTPPPVKTTVAPPSPRDNLCFCKKTQNRLRVTSRDALFVSSISRRAETLSPLCPLLPSSSVRLRLHGGGAGRRARLGDGLCRVVVEVQLAHVRAAHLGVAVQVDPFEGKLRNRVFTS
jgi:hypothetical protein